ncbi:MAG: hypothetical protein M1818_006692 [Claussenomyces sp. TS43310]|nr:MAG: hypothetical protein M1818_006692 [Claussenomyces sp. TS43310]
MVSVLKRMRALKALLNIKLGPGAAILPPEVTRIHLDFAVKINDGHAGPRKFWRNCLPRLKYHNPAVPMSVTRTTNQEGPALLTIHFTDATSAHTIPPPVSSTTAARTSVGPVAATTSMPPTQRTEVINMKHRTDSEILSQLMALTKARPVDPTPRDLEDIRKLEEFKVKSDADKAVSQKVRDDKAHHAAMLAQARGEIVATPKA